MKCSNFNSKSPSIYNEENSHYNLIMTSSMRSTRNFATKNSQRLFLKQTLEKYFTICKRNYYPLLKANWPKTTFLIYQSIISNAWMLKIIQQKKTFGNCFVVDYPTVIQIFKEEFAFLKVIKKTTRRNRYIEPTLRINFFFDKSEAFNLYCVVTLACSRYTSKRKKKNRRKFYTTPNVT